jgi:hypothetical protein
MSVILSLLGIVVAAVGVAAIGFGIPINEFSIGTTLILAGATALTGGLILIGIAAVVAELGRINEALKTRAVVRPAARAGESPEPLAPAAPSAVAAPTPRAAVGARPSPVAASVSQRPRPEAPVRETRAPESRPAAASAGDVSAGAIERLRSNIPRTDRSKTEPAIVAEDEEVPLSPNEAVPQQGPAPQPFGPKVTAEDRAGGAAVEALKASRLDFLFRSKPARPASQPEKFDTFWPAGSRAAPRTEPEPQPALDDAQGQAEQGAQAAPVQDRAPEAGPVEEPRTAAILKSGVIDGMAYTLYADGSIEAKLPQGTVRFGSIAELRAHIESNS